MSAFVTDGISVLASKVVVLVDVVVVASTDDRFVDATDSLLPLVAAAAAMGVGLLPAGLPSTASSATATAFSSGTLAAESTPLPSCCVALASIIGTAISSAFVAGRFSDMVAPPWFDAPTGDSVMIIYPCSSVSLRACEKYLAVCGIPRWEGDIISMPMLSRINGWRGDVWAERRRQRSRRSGGSWMIDS